MYGDALKDLFDLPQLAEQNFGFLFHCRVKSTTASKRNTCYCDHISNTAYLDRVGVNFLDRLPLRRGSLIFPESLARSRRTLYHVTTCGGAPSMGLLSSSMMSPSAR